MLLIEVLESDIHKSSHWQSHSATETGCYFRLFFFFLGKRNERADYKNKIEARDYMTIPN